MSAEEEQIDTDCLVEESTSSPGPGLLLSALLLTWAGASALFFFIRFSFLFFGAHQEAIKSLYQRLAGG